jgi:hypothetical protein
MATNSGDIEKVAVALGDLKDRCFIAGGASIPFYLTDKLEEHPRITLDIDIAIEVESRYAYRTSVETQMRAKGFVNDISEGAPICRWKLGHVTVDIMPTDASVLGFSNKWFAAGVSSLIPVQVTDSCAWRILSPPFMLATKCTAFSDRGICDPGSSSDLEDIVTLVNGRPTLGSEIAGSATECKEYLSRWFSGILKDSRIMEVIPYHLPPHAAGQSRFPLVLDRMKRISTLLE